LELPARMSGIMKAQGETLGAQPITRACLLAQVNHWLH